MTLSKQKEPIFKMRYYGDPALAAKAAPVAEITDEIRALAGAMTKYMYEKDGIGLAGNQVGILKRIVVIHATAAEDENGDPVPGLSPGERELLPKMPVALINPEILSVSEELSDFEEGCLSVPKLYARVRRPASVVLKSQLLDGSSVLAECGGLLARVIQHELDHLDGIVFVQKALEEDYRKIKSGVEKLIRKNGPRNFKVRRLV